MKANFLQLLVIYDLSTVKNVSRLYHGLVNAFIIQFDEFVPFSANNDCVRSVDGRVWVGEDFDMLFNFIRAVGNTR